MTTKLKRLNARYETCCTEFIAEFCRKQDIEFDGWVADKVGGIASFIDQYFFDIPDIVYDLTTDQPKGLIMDWQDWYVSHEEKINYYAFSKGIRIEDKTNDLV